MALNDAENRDEQGTEHDRSVSYEDTGTARIIPLDGVQTGEAVNGVGPGSRSAASLAPAGEHDLMKWLFTLLVLVLNGSATAGDRPDIVLLVADDLGWGDISCLDGDFPTPAIDRLAAQGAILDAFYSGSSSCTPSRYALFTGRNSWRSQGGLDRVLMYFTEKDPEIFPAA